MHDIEKRSLGLAKWANLLMGVAGIVAALGSNASALMLDGLFSGVNFVAAVLAARVASSVRRKPDAVRPFGYEIDEPMYVMFRALVLTGVIIVAAFNALDKITAYLAGEILAEVKLDWVVAYMGIMLAVCGGLAWWHHRNWVKTNRKSDLLRAERGAAMIDGVLSAAAGAAFLAIALLRQTPLAFLVPISDAIVVLCLAAYMIPKPVRTFLDAAKEVLGESADNATTSRVRQCVEGVLASGPYDLIEVAVTKLGRALFAVAYVKPSLAASVDELDALRKTVRQAASTVHTPLRMEIIFTGKKPYE